MKNFFDFQDEKITEKAFSKNIIVSIAGILLSIVMLCSTTYAWFTGIMVGEDLKISKADYVIYNDGNKAVEPQVLEINKLLCC